MRCCSLLILLAACATQTEPVTAGAWTVTPQEDGSFDITGAWGSWTGGRIERAEPAPPTIEMNLGSFRFGDAAPGWSAATSTVRAGDGAITLGFDDGQTVTLVAALNGDALDLQLQPGCGEDNRCAPAWWRLSFDCEADDHFLGAGSHAQDLDHVGEAFPLWTSEPGIGKTDTDELPDQWFLTGTRHATSFPVPWLVRPQQAAGTLLRTAARVELDLCHTDAGRWSMASWGQPELTLIDAAAPVDVVRQLTARTRRATAPPRWAFGAWADAIRGVDRVRSVAAALRDADASVSVIWSEDWKGANETATGYRLSEEWDLDTNLYPDTVNFDAELQALGFQWFAYFAPFVGMTAQSGADATAADALVLDPDRGPYTFTGVTFKPTGHLDAFSDAGRAWATTKMRAALDAGFDGWMADYGEWLPADAIVDGGAEPTGLDVHNAYPAAWQQLNLDAVAGRDATFFCRSGWYDSLNLCPITWVGDQRTSFDADDGLPSVLPLVLGLSWSGVGVTTHDVAGYQSVGNPPSTEEVWLRWAALGAFSPIFRTHHGSFDTDNWQFDSTPETLATFARLTREHGRLLPYRFALAAAAAADGTPMVQPTAWRFPGEPWDRIDAWMLGPNLLVAPVVEGGVTGREVALPAGDWYDYTTEAPAASGWFDAAPGEISVFVPRGAVIPRYLAAPDTELDGAGGAVTGHADADAAREIVVWGGAGAFVEADGTRYDATGAPTGAGEVTQTLASGTIEAAGIRLQIDGEVSRAYTLRVIP